MALLYLCIPVAYIVLIWRLANRGAGIFSLMTVSAGFVILLMAFIGNGTRPTRGVFVAGFAIFSYGIVKIVTDKKRLDKEKSDKSPLEADTDSTL